MEISPAIAECRIPDVRTAAIVVRGLEGASKCLADAVQEIGKYESAEQRKLIGRAIGTVIAMDMHDLLMSLLFQHPNLDRHGLILALKGEGADRDD